MESDLVKETKQYVNAVFTEEVSDDLYFHNLVNAEQVVAASAPSFTPTLLIMVSMRWYLLIIAPIACLI
jgi:hypothetical protein